jgi:hypothetical protein
MQQYGPARASGIDPARMFLANQHPAPNTVRILAADPACDTHGTTDAALGKNIMLFAAALSPLRLTMLLLLLRPSLLCNAIAAAAAAAARSIFMQ